MSRCVLDSSAIMVALDDEPGAAMVWDALHDDSVVGAVNHSEVVTKLSERGVEPAEIERRIRGLALAVIAFDEDQAFACGLLRPATRHLGLSLGDRACLALAQRLQLPALTADRIWEQLQLDIPIHHIR